MRKITLLLTLCLVCVGLGAQVNYQPTNVTQATKTNTGRNMTSVAVSGESYALANSEQSMTYVDKYDAQTFTVSQGQELSFEINTEGSWIHGTVYIDFDKDGFTASVTDNWKPAEDLVAYSFYNNNGASDESGWNSVGTPISGNNRNRPAIPNYTIPDTMTPGEYRIRFQLDWCSIDPNGDADGKFKDFMDNGGQILDAKLVVTENVGTVLPAPIEASAFVAGKNYLIKNVAVNKYLYNDGNALKLSTIADLANIPDQYLFAAVEVTGGVALMASNGGYVPGTGADGTALTTTATPTAVNVSAKGGTYPLTTLNVEVGGSDNYWNIVGGATGSELGFWYDQNDANGVWEFRNMGDSDVDVPEPPTFPYVVTNVSNLDFSCLYTIDQPHHKHGATSWAVGNDALKSNVDLSKDIDATDVAQQFAFYSTDDGATVYLYHPASKKFINLDGSLGNAPLNPVSFSNGYVANTFVLKFDNSHYINVGGSRQMVIDSWSTADEGNSCRITAIGEFDPNEALTTVLVGKAEQALAPTGVGYPVAAERTALENALAALKNEATQENRDNLITKLTEFAATTNVNMPENGKAYTFVNKQKNGTLYYMKYAESGMTFTSDAAEATPFVCKVLDNGKFVFVNNAGKYMVWRGSTAGTNDQKGYVDAYDTSADAWCDIELTKVNEGDKVDAGNEETLFGCLYFKGRRNDPSAAKDHFAYTVIKADGSYDQASVPFFNANFSSAIMLVEATYPNTPELKDATGLGVTALATFSAPFATVVPEGVIAWYATSESEGESVVMEQVDGAIPAGQGVVLSGDLGKVTMVPAAAEDQADLTGNVLVGTAGAAKEFTSNEGVYILGNKEGQVAFYPLADGEQTLGMNKAYLQLAAGGAVVKMNFGGESTGIVAVEKGLNENAPIYDLSGRRVLSTVKGGVYIQAGRKFIVK